MKISSCICIDLGIPKSKKENLGNMLFQLELYKEAIGSFDLTGLGKSKDTQRLTAEYFFMWGLSFCFYYR